MAGTSKKVGDVVNPEGPLAVSKIESETFTFFWDVENFSKMQNNRLKSPPFKEVRDSNKERNWYMQIRPKNEKDGMEYLGIFVFLLSETDNNAVDADYQISIVDSNRRILKTTGCSSKSPKVKEFVPKGQGWGRQHWIRRCPMFETEFLTNDTLKLHCRITIHSKLKHEQFDQLRIDPESTVKDDHSTIAKKRMQSFLINGDFSDITLETRSTSYPCSKIVLAAQSPVFLAMFNSGMLETKENVVKIEDFAKETVKGMLDFLYTGSVDSLKDNATDLLKIADKYQIDGLKSKCADFLEQELDIENAASTLILADLYGPLSFKQKVVSFITRNRKKVQRTDGFILMKEHHKTIFADLYTAIE